MSTPATPTKVYDNEGKYICTCRLCGSVGDQSHWKNLFSKGNIELYSLAEKVYGHDLCKSDKLPHLLCRPCERRLKNFQAFRSKIADAQKSFNRIKRCSGISPCVQGQRSSKRNSGTGRQLTFTSTLQDFQQSEPSAAKVHNKDALQDTEEIVSNPVLFNNVVEKILTKIDDELVEAARRDKPSVLRKRGFTGLSEVSFFEIIDELRTSCPLVYKFLSCMIDESHNVERKTLPLALIYSIILFRRCHELSRIQRMNTILLVEGNANQKVLDRLSKYGFCLSNTAKYSLLDEIGDHFLDKAVQLVKSGGKFVIVMDNIDWMVKVSDMRSDVQNQDVHAVAASLVFDRVPPSNIPDTGPKKVLAKCDIKEVIAESLEETIWTRKRYKVILAEILCEFLPSFSYFSDIASMHLPCQHAQEMNTKSVVVPLPVILKDEKKYADLVYVMDQLETWIHEMYAKAGVTSSCCVADNSIREPPVPQVNDPLEKVKVPLFGDQLTRVRCAGAKDLRAGCHTSRQRFDHLYPFCIADWHTKRSFLKLIYKKLYRKSIREKGTLRYFREKLQRRNVTEDIKHYEDCEQLFLSVGRCYVIESLLHFFGMESMDDSPQKHIPPREAMCNEDDKKKYFDIVLDEWLDKYLFDSPVVEPTESQEPVEEDFITNYSICLLKYFFVMVDYKNAVKEGDGQRLASLHKQLLKHFKTTPSYNAYAIEMLVNVLQNEVLLSEAESNQCIWAYTASWKGGKDKNIEADLMQENRNRDMKALIKNMGANKTNKAIERASRASGGVMEIVENFDESVNIHTTSAHKHKSSSNDEKKMLADLQELKPFSVNPGRKHEFFPNFSPDPLSEIKETELNNWLARHKKKILLHIPEEQQELDEMDVT